MDKVAATEYPRLKSPQRWQILGVRLQPFSLQHYFLLSREANAFVADADSEAGLQDLIVGVLICSRRWSESEFEDYVDSGECQLDAEILGEAVGKQMAEDRSAFDLPAKIQLLDEYIKAHSQCPIYADNHDVTDTSGSHWSQNILLCLTGKLGYERSDALNCPLPQALADYFKYAESQGLITLLPEWEVDQIREMEKEENAKS
jgi:hypothetical protein